MLNYLKAEWWKALRRPLLWGVALVLLAGIVYLLVRKGYQGEAVRDLRSVSAAGI